MMEVEVGEVEDVVGTWGCGAGEDQPGDRPHQGRSEALDESSEVGEMMRRELELELEVVEWIVSHC